MSTVPWRRSGAAGTVAAVLLVLSMADAGAQGLPASALSVKVGAEWRQVWNSSEASAVWPAAHPEMLRALNWKPVAPGVDRAELSVSGNGLAWRTRLIVVRLDPSRLEIALASAVRDGGSLGAWTVDSAPDEALLALNAGQFSGGRPWGWVVRDGSERQPPGTGALGMALVVDRDGGISLVEPDSIAAVRARGEVAQAFQSYPMLLADGGRVPPQLRGRGRGIDVDHRDSRLAVGRLRDGRILIVLTRFEGLGGILQTLPFGPTTPEMAALMGGLGCEAAMLLDGGLSGQLLVRDAAGRALTWSGMRRVPLGLIVRSRG